MRVDYLGLEAFVAIAEYGSFQRAADALHLSQAALSHRLRKIEADIGSPLLIRSSREVSLTAIGQGLLPEARALLTRLNDVYQSVRTGGRRQARQLTFACLPSIANVLLSEVLTTMAERLPDSTFELLDIPVNQISEAVRSGTAAFGVTIVAAEMPDLQLLPLVEEDYHLFLREDHPLAQRDYVMVKDIIGQRLARIRSQSKNRQLLDTTFGALGEKINWQFEVQNGVMALQLVRAGMAVTILPESAIAIAPATLVSRPFKGVQLKRTLGIVSRRGVPVSALASDMMTMIEAELLKRFRSHVALSADRLHRPRD
jgi:DNA-binding transcriptional LysR family regulator